MTSTTSSNNSDPRKSKSATENQLIMEREKKSTVDTKNTELDYPTSGNYMSGNSTSSGGYGSQPEKVWSNRSQRGVDMPLNEAEASVVDQYNEGTGLGEKKIQDANEGRDILFEDEWGIEQGAGKDF